ncbi:unnamed protein product [Mucor hiemalis]
MAYHHSTTSTMNFPPGTFTSKLSSKKLKKPPSPKDWMHQTYLQMIQDVSYVTSHYYESTENGNHLLFGNKNCQDRNETPSPKKNATVHDTKVDTPPTPPPKDCYLVPAKGKEKEIPEIQSSEDDEYDEEDEDDSQCYNSFTTSSTDCNRKNNIYRFYREQQSLQTDPIMEESSVIRVATPYSSGSNCNISTISNNESYSTSISGQSELGQDQQLSDDCASTVTQLQHERKSKKKKFKLLKNMMTKMKMAAEKPFWAIDSHF